MALAGIGYRDETWPRDFRGGGEPTGGLMFIGTALRWINKAVDRTAHEDDVRLGIDFIDRPDRDNPHIVESFESQRWAYQRGETARGILLDWLRRGTVECFWLPEDGQFQQIAPEIWTNRAEVTDGALRRFGLADGYFEHDGRRPAAGRRFVYVSARQLLACLVGLNAGARRGFPDEPERLLDTLGGDAAVEDWPLLVTLTWIATRDERATAGALAYPRTWEGGDYAQVAADAADGFIEQQIADFFCACRKPNCDCWSSAKIALAHAAQGVTPTIVGFGFRNNAGDVEQIPATAWRGALSFDSHSWIEPERSGGTRWGSVYFRADDVRHAFPAQLVDAPATKPVPVPGSWKTWAVDAVSRGVGVGGAHADAKDKLGDTAPSRDKARSLVRDEESRRGIVAKQGPRGPRKT